MQDTRISLRETLAGRLAEFTAAARPGRLSLGLQLDGEPLFFEYDGPGSLRAADGAGPAWAPAGCLAKTITASLVAVTVCSRRIDWDSPISRLLDLSDAAASYFAGITLRHLLTHTHGLDASMIRNVPLTPDSFIDVPALTEELAVPRLSAPGELYSYSNAGFWLAAAALEHIAHTPYASLLSAIPCFYPSDITQTHDASYLCPATGGSLALTPAQWISFLDTHSKAGATSTEPHVRSLASLRDARVALPGWSASEQAICLGWKYYGEEWFGHTANMADAVTSVRFNPRDGTAIAMSASTDLAPFALSCLFRDYLPELTNPRFPRRLTPLESNSMRRDAYVGIYAQARTRVEIMANNDGPLSFVVSSQDPISCTQPQSLKPADNHIFLPDGRRSPEFLFIQFLPPSGPEFTHLWNGKHLWRRP